MTISDTLKRAVLGITSDQVLVTLLTFSGDGFTTFRVCDNDTDITSNGDIFTAFPFEIVLPGDREDAPAATLRIANVSKEIGQAIDEFFAVASGPSRSRRRKPSRPRSKSAKVGTGNPASSALAPSWNDCHVVSAGQRAIRSCTKPTGSER